MKAGKQRTLFSNYFPWELEKDARESLKAEGYKNPSDEEIQSWICEQLDLDWSFVREELEKFFNDDSKWIIFGTVGRWDGTYKGSRIFTDFMEMFSKATKGCESWHLYDINGHFYLDCSHHDGSNAFEIKRVTEKGVQYYENWEYSYSDHRTEEYVYQKLAERYSVLPHFAHKRWGYPKKEYAA